MGQEKEYVAEITGHYDSTSYDLRHLLTGSFRMNKWIEPVWSGRSSSLSGRLNSSRSLIRPKVDGVRRMRWSPSGDEVEMKSRKVMVRDIEILKVELPIVELRIVCSKGTYIRSLAHDLGKACGSGSHLSALRRTRVGDFRVEDGFKMDEIIEFTGKFVI